MPPPYGVTPTGFNRKTVDEILSGIRARQLSDISPALNVSTSSPWGQANGIVANEIGIAWEILEVCYQAFDRDQAQDFLLTSLGKLTGTERRPASFSLVELTCTLDAGTVLVSGENFAEVEDEPTNRWTPLVDYTAPTTGAQTVLFRAESPGAVVANAGTIEVISTSVIGWTSVTNASDADVGREIDTDPILRARSEEQLTATGSATADAVEADLLEIEGIDSVTVFENDTDVEVGGIPAHHLRPVVFDGETPSVANNIIAQTIFDSKAGGIGTTGATSGIATDDDGATHTVWFDRPDQLTIYASLTVVPGPRYADLGGATGLRSYLVDELKAIHSLGQDVQYRLADSLALYFGGLRQGVSGVTAFTLGTSPGPTGTVDIAVADDELAVFDTSRIVVSV